MGKETYINGNKTIIDTDYYLKLLNCEQENKKLEEHIEILRVKFDKYKKTISPKKLLEEHDLYKSVLKEIKEKIDFAKATIEYDCDYSNIGYNFLISADKIIEILDKVEL